MANVGLEHESPIRGPRPRFKVMYVPYKLYDNFRPFGI